MPNQRASFQSVNQGDPQGTPQPIRRSWDLPAWLALGNTRPFGPCAPPPGPRGRAARTRGHVTPSCHGGGSRRSPFRACGARPVFLHSGPRPRALPDPGGAGAARCHPGESASQRAGARSRAAQAPPLPVVPPGGPSPLGSALDPRKRRELVTVCPRTQFCWQVL